MSGISLLIYLIVVSFVFVIINSKFVYPSISNKKKNAKNLFLFVCGLVVWDLPGLFKLFSLIKGLIGTDSSLDVVLVMGLMVVISAAIGLVFSAIYSKIIHSDLIVALVIYTQYFLILSSSLVYGDAIISIALFAALIAFTLIVLSKDARKLSDHLKDFDHFSVSFVCLFCLAILFLNIYPIMDIVLGVSGISLQFYKFESVLVAVVYTVFFKILMNVCLKSYELRKANGEKAEANDELSKLNENIIYQFAIMIENKSGETGKHVQRVSEYSVVIARTLGYGEKEVEDLRLASMLHDVGKLMISNEILGKQGKFTVAEYREMQQHVMYGGHLLENCSGRILKMAHNIALEHHERWDGNGYLMNLKGDEIDKYAQIVAVADVFDALTSARSYKEAWPCDLARDEIVKNRGTQFSPRCVDAFVESYNEILATKKRIDEAVDAEGELAFEN